MNFQYIELKAEEKSLIRALEKESESERSKIIDQLAIVKMLIQDIQNHGRIRLTTRRTLGIM
jgi:hypothetical protein